MFHSCSNFVGCFLETAQASCRNPKTLGLWNGNQWANDEKKRSHFSQEDRRVVSPKVGSELAQQLGLMYFECSAKTFQGVDNPFYYLANEWHTIHQEKADRMSELSWNYLNNLKLCDHVYL